MNKELVTVKDGVPVTDSLTVAKHFNKRHDNVIANIEKLIKDINILSKGMPSDQSLLKIKDSTFIKGEYIDSTGKTNPLYYMTEDGFHLLAMGFTGKRALEYKICWTEVGIKLPQWGHRSEERSAFCPAEETPFSMGLAPA